GVVSHPRTLSHPGARGRTLRRHHHRRGGAVRAPQPAGAQLSAPRRAGRRRDGLAQDRRPGEGLLDRAPPDGHRGPGRRSPALRPPRNTGMSRVRVEVAGTVGRITLARPEKKNALDLQAALELLDALQRLADDPAVRVILLGADGSDFCAGADLAALGALLEADADTHRRDAEALGRVFTTIRELPKPVVAAVRGRALAGGAGLATACDIVLAEEGAQFGYPEVRVGFVPAMVMTMLRRIAGEKRAFDLVATGRIVGATEALQIGLVSRVLPADGFDAAVQEIVAGLAASPRGALALTKRLFYDLDTLSFADGIALGARTNVEARSTNEFRDGVRSFLNRARKPS